MSYEEALRRVEQAQRANTRSLNLRGLGLTDNQLCEWQPQPQPQRGLFSFFWSEKKTLILSALLDKILRLTALRELYLSDNQLTSLPESFGQLTALETLFLSNNQLTSLPESLGQLTALRNLKLNKNRLTSVPRCIGQLTALQRLDLDDNRLASVPGSFDQLTALEKFDLSGNRLMSVPEHLGQLTALRMLNLSRNRLKSVPEHLGQLTALETLFLSSNQLTSMPESLGGLTALRALDLSHNRLTSLPESLGELRALETLNLRENVGLGIPLEILDSRDPKETLYYYFRVRAGAHPLNEAKLILVGRGRVGKTSLVKKLKSGGFNPNESETEGIEIENWEAAVCFDETSNKTETVHLHIWDFGGQEFAHATHRFFLTERTLYLLVLNGRAGGVVAEAEYWLELIQGAGENSRVLVVLNKNDEHPFDVNRGLLEEKFKNICGFIKTDCKTGLGIENLKEAIKNETARLDGVHSSFPSSWFRLKERVSGMQEAFLTFDGFQKLCAEYEIEEADRDLLADVLNALGIALNFRKDTFLQSTHILNPRWVTGGVYAILYSPKVRNAKGVMKLADLQAILDAKEYPPHMHGFLMRLMQRFELCFPFPNDPDSFLIPELLSENQSKKVREFKPEDCLNFEYHYSVLPEGLVPRFIVRTHEQSEGEPRWRTGVILNVEGCRALVRADVLGKKIFVRISGDELARRRVLSVIRSHFNAIHQAVKLKAEEMVPIPGKPAAAVSYLELEKFEKKGVTEFPKLIGEDVEMVNVRELLNGVRLSVTDLRAGLLTKVSKLTESQFVLFLELLEAPNRFLPSDKTGVAERAAGLFQWIRQQETIRLEDVAKAYDDVTRDS